MWEKIEEPGIPRCLTGARFQEPCSSGEKMWHWFKITFGNWNRLSEKALCVFLLKESRSKVGKEWTMAEGEESKE